MIPLRFIQENANGSIEAAHWRYYPIAVELYLLRRGIDVTDGYLSYQMKGKVFDCRSLIE